MKCSCGRHLRTKADLQRHVELMHGGPRQTTDLTTALRLEGKDLGRPVTGGQKGSGYFTILIKEEVL